MLIFYGLAALLVLNMLSIGKVGYKARKTKLKRLKTDSLRHTKIPFQKKAGNEHILVLGDSTMHGYGAEKPENTVGGLLARRYSTASVETLAQNGARVADLNQQLSKATHQDYKLIFIGIGGNDVLRLTRFPDIKQTLDTFLKTISKRTTTVILVHSVNLGNTGAFVFPVNYFFDYRMRRLSSIYSEVAKQHKNVAYISFYRPFSNDFYTAKTRSRFIASDGFHPSDYANQFFFKLTEKHLP